MTKKMSILHNKLKFSIKFKNFFSSKNSSMLKKSKIAKNSKKTSLLRKLVTSSTLLIAFSLAFSGFASYIIVKNKTTEDFKTSAVQVLNQNMNYINLIANTVDSKSIELLSNDIFTGLLTHKYGEDPYEKFHATTQIHDTIKSIPISNIGMISSVYLLNTNGFANASDSTIISDETLKEASLEPWYKKAVELDGNSIWVTHTNNISANKELVISNVRMIENTSSMNKCGLLMINISPEALSSTLKNSKLGQNGYMFVVDKDGYIVSHKDISMVGKKVDSSLLSKLQGNGGTIEGYTENKKSMYGVYTTSQDTQWKFVAIVPKSDLSATANYTGLISMVIILVFILISFLASIATTKQITKPINAMIGITKEMSNGNLNVECSSQKLRELDELSSNFNQMITNLKAMLFTTKELSQDTDEASKNLLTLSQDMSSAADEINSAVGEIAGNSMLQTESTLSCVDISESFNSEITNSIESLDLVNHALKNTIGIIDNSTNVISSLKDTSNTNSSSMSEVSTTIEDMGENAKDILSILDKINGIAAQTNLLALNASIEAARAGDAGRGFSVVANEIRKLAEESQKASLDINSIIKNVNASLSSALSISKEAKTAFNDELSQVNTTINSFDSIKKSAYSIINKMEEAMTSIKIINDKKDVLFNSINNISQISQKNSAASEEVTASVEQQTSANNQMYSLSSGMTEKAAKLKGAIEKFKF